MKSIYDIILDKLFKMIESGVAPWRATWLKEQMNGVTMKSYKGFNTLYLSFVQEKIGYSSPIWLTWKQITELGGKIIKGSESAIVFFAKKVEKDKNEADKELLEIDENKKSYFFWRYYRVFNLDCVEGIDKSKWLKTHNDLKNPEEMVNGWECSIKHGGTRACYSPDIDIIVVPNKNTFNTIEDYYATVFHEIIHSTGHKKRLNRPLSIVEEKYSFEELIAEIGSAFLCVETGVEPNYENSASYIKGWSEFFRNNRKQTILQACSQANKAVEFVIKNSLKTKKEEAI